MMKSKVTLILFVIGLSFNLNAQYTKGGSEKNYNQYHLTYDTIVTTTKVKIPFDKYHFQYLSFGYALPIGDAKNLPSNYWSKNQIDYNLYYPVETGKIGLKKGFYFSTGGFKGLDFINKNLITSIDIGLEQNFDVYLSKADWSELKQSIPITFNNTFKDLYSNVLSSKMGSFYKFGYGIGPAIVFHTPVKDLDVRAGYLANFGLILSKFNSVYYNGTSFNALGLPLTVDYSASFNYGDMFVNFKLNNQIKIGVLYKLLYFGTTINLQSGTINKRIDIYEDYNESGYDELGLYYTNYGGSTNYTNTNYKISFLSLDLGLKFKGKSYNQYK